MLSRSGRAAELTRSLAGKVTPITDRDGQRGDHEPDRRFGVFASVSDLQSVPAPIVQVWASLARP
jgi:hypothetical protein